MVLFTFQCFTIFRKHDLEDKYQVLRRQIILMLFMNFIAYALLYIQSEEIKFLFMYGAVFIFIGKQRSAKLLKHATSVFIGNNLLDFLIPKTART